MILCKDRKKASRIYKQEKKGLKEPLKDKCLVEDEAKGGGRMGYESPKRNSTRKEKPATAHEAPLWSTMPLRTP